MFKINANIIMKIEKYIYLIHIIIPIFLACIVNLYIFKNELYKNNDKRNIYLPQGYIIGIIWTIILGLLGYLHYLTYEKSILSRIIVFIIIYCLLYPLLTYKLDNSESIKYNLLGLLLAFILFILIILKYKQKNIIYIYVLPLLFWNIYICIITIFFDDNIKI